jgi:D-glycero-D-manno-heptose 1,7-bisphosphate phosphatase
MARAVFLDRDGVLNRAPVREGRPGTATSLEELEILPGVMEACQLLRTGGFVLVVVTNQPDVARGLIPRDRVEAIHRHLRAHIPLDDVRVCFHDDQDGCACRKPLPGLLLSAARDWRIDLARSFMVGDRWRDIDAGHAAGCTSVLLDHRYLEELRDEPDARFASLLEAARWIIEQTATCT